MRDFYRGYGNKESPPFKPAKIFPVGFPTYYSGKGVEGVASAVSQGILSLSIMQICLFFLSWPPAAPGVGPGSAREAIENPGREKAIKTKFRKTRSLHGENPGKVSVF